MIKYVYEKEACQSGTALYFYLDGKTKNEIDSAHSSENKMYYRCVTIKAVDPVTKRFNYTVGTEEVFIYEINSGIQEFYYCRECQSYYCEKDKEIHENMEEENHNLVNLKNIDNICLEHFKIINDYCLECHQNICHKCISHSKHEKVPISKLIIKDNKLAEYRNRLNKLKNDKQYTN